MNRITSSDDWLISVVFKTMILLTLIGVWFVVIFTGLQCLSVC